MNGMSRWMCALIPSSMSWPALASRRAATSKAMRHASGTGRPCDVLRDRPEVHVGEQRVLVDHPRPVAEEARLLAQDLVDLARENQVGGREHPAVVAPERAPEALHVAERVVDAAEPGLRAACDGMGLRVARRRRSGRPGHGGRRGCGNQHGQRQRADERNPGSEGLGAPRRARRPHPSQGPPSNGRTVQRAWRSSCRHRARGKLR
jgi:hypothetical protein